MNNLKSVILPVIISAVIATLFVFLFQRPSETPISREDLGATPGSDISGNYFSVGGVEFAHVKQSYVASSTGMCIFRNPFRGATSTLVRFTANSSTLIAGANSFDLSTTSHSGGYGATSTVSFVVNHNVPTLTYDNLVWVPTFRATSTVGAVASARISQTLGSRCYADGSCPFVIRPRDFVTWKRNATSSGSGTDDFRGTCTATFQKM